MAISADELAKKSTLEIDPAELEYPKVADPPEGWSTLRAIDGNTWYQRALNYEDWQGQRLLPLKYTYNESGQIILNPDYKENE